MYGTISCIIGKRIGKIFESLGTIDTFGIHDDINSAGESHVVNYNVRIKFDGSLDLKGNTDVATTSQRQWQNAVTISVF
jgi:hypothetical protein